MAEHLSLFGWPVPELRLKAGRPEHIPTEENRNKVMWLLTLGRKNHEIAAGIGVSQPTLRRHYLQQLSQRKSARLQLEATRGAKLVEKVLAGDTSAIRELGREMRKLDETDIATKFGEAAPQRARKLGKKEAAQIEASNAGEGSEWGDDLLPPGTRAN